MSHRARAVLSLRGETSQLTSPAARIPAPLLETLGSEAASLARTTRRSASHLFEPVTGTIKRFDPVELLVLFPKLPAQPLDVTIDGTVVDNGTLSRSVPDFE